LVGFLEIGDNDFFHGASSPSTVRPAEALTELFGDDLPGETIFIFQPAALTLTPAILN
jgi:hypothetical protein